MTVNGLRAILTGTGAIALSCIGSQASAATLVLNCDPLTDLSVQATQCSGWYAGNLLNNGGSNVSEQQTALSSIGLDWDGNWSLVDLTKVNASGPDENVFDFNSLLNGDVWIGIHKGKGGKDGYESTAFYRLTASDLDSVTLNLKGASSAVVYAQRSAVPEPGTWAMLLLGFGALGAALRRRREAVAPLQLAARH